MEPTARASPMGGTWGRGVLSSSQCSTVLNIAWSPFSSSTLPSDTVGTQAPQVRGPCSQGPAVPAALAPATDLAVPSDPGMWGSLLHPACSQRSQAPGNTCSNPPVYHEARRPGTLLTPFLWTQMSQVPLCPTLLPAPRALRCLGSPLR